MTEIKKTLAILKNRWPEVTLIIGLNILLALSNKLFPIENSGSASIFTLSFFIFTMALIVIWSILNFGFQRTVYLEADRQQQPMVLLKTGRRFFWRMFRLGLLWLPIYCILIWLTFLVTKPLTSVNTGFFETATLSPLLYQFYFTAPSLILIKPLLLIPAIIIVLDCKVLEGFKYLKRYRLFDAMGLPILFLISIIFSFSWVLLPKAEEIKTILQYIPIIVHLITGQFLSLMIAVTAVRFVASLDLVYDDQPVSSDFEDLKE